GISAYDRTQIQVAIDLLPLDIVQLPMNLLDQRMLRDGTLAKLKQRNIELHARSAFLQGALLADPAALPDHFVLHRAPLAETGRIAGLQALSRLTLCLRFLLDRPELDRVLVGVTRVAELRQILAAAADPTPLPDLAALASDDLSLINPSLWPA